MRREVSLEEISDGKLYQGTDMVKADCFECQGCCDCCTGMGDTVILDPLDVHRLSQGLGKIWKSCCPCIWNLVWQMEIFFHICA